MRRRNFIGGVAGALFVRSSFFAHAQQPTFSRIGILRPLPPTAFPETLNAFRGGLAELGYVEGGNLAIENRWSTGQYEQLPALAAELVQRQVSLIFTGGGAVSTLAAKAVTRTIPIVFVVGDDPIRAGIVASLNRPESNVTGISLYAFDIETKKLEVLTEMVPKARTIAVLRNPTAPEAQPQADMLKSAATKLGRELHLISASTNDQIDAAFATLSRLHADAMLVVNDVFFSVRSGQVIALAQKHSIPAIFDFRHHVVAGGLISYGSSLTGAYRQAGTYAGRILKGEKPTDLPVMQPTKFEMVINLKTAGALGLSVPPTLLSRADHVIE
jgi:putative ABC transport system substrate-binding protein